MITKTSQSTFSGGLLSPLMYRRDDWQKFSNGLKQCTNFLPLKEGSLFSRPGTTFVKEIKDSSVKPRLKSFIFSQTQSYVLEFGNLYVRFYRNEGRLESSPGVAYEVVTPYSINDVHALDFEQSADVLYIAHPNYPFAALKRYADLNWKHETITFNPPPTKEQGQKNASTLTLSATTGNITVTTTSFFLAADVNRIIEDITPGFQGQAIITAYTSDTQVSATVIKPFSQTSITSNNWKLKGSPAAILHSTLQSPVGALTDLTLLKITNQSELVSNGAFTSNLNDWDNYSGGQITSGTHTGANAMKFQLTDNTKNFLSLGVGTNMIAKKTGADNQSVITGVTDITLYLNATTNDTPYNTSDAYAVLRTGSATQSNGAAVLNGGPNGLAWIEQDIATTAGDYYQLSFRVQDAAITCMVGSASKTSNILPETAYDIGFAKLTFKALDSTTYIQFRSNQPVDSRLDDVSCKLFEVNGFRSSDVGKFVHINNGIVEVTNFVSNTQVQGVIRKNLDPVTKFYALPDSSDQQPVLIPKDSEALAGTWSIEESRFITSNPSKVALFQERLWLNSSADPLRMYASVVGDFHNFARGVIDDDSIEFVLASSQINTILWMEGGRTLNCGTEAAEFVIQGALGEAVKPSSITANPVTFHGSSDVPPLVIGNSITIFIQRGALKVIAFDFSPQQNSTVGTDLTLYVNDVFPDVLTQLAYQAQPNAMIWALCNDGSLFSCTFAPEQQVLGWAKHTLTNGVVEQIQTIPSPNGSKDQLWMMVRRTINGVTKRYIEYLDDHNSKNTWKQMTVDSALTYTGAAVSTISGLTHLEGQVVHAISNNTNLGTFTVSGGAITLPQTVTSADVGLPFTPTVQPLRPVIRRPGADIQTGERTSTSKIAITVYKSMNMDIYKPDGVTLIKTIPFRNTTMLTDVAPPLFTGVKEEHINISDFEDSDLAIVIKQTLPYPLNILDIVRDVSINPPQ